MWRVALKAIDDSSNLSILSSIDTVTIRLLRDSVPDQFTFTDITDATDSTIYTSNYVTLNNFDSAYASFIGSGTGAGGSFRNAVLLTHSSGSRLYDYETYMNVDSGDITSVPLEMDDYNTANSYTGADTVGMQKRWYPEPDGTDWANWYADFTGTLAGNDIYAKLDTFNVIIFKGGIQTCNMTGYGSASDTTSENISARITDKTTIIYKYIWREMVDSMAAHPEAFWVVMTGSASGDNMNTPTGAQLAHEFATWAKDTLATGNDAYGTFPSNVYVFDYFHYLDDAEHYLQDGYESAPDDDHPNATACNVIAPIFVQEVFDASIVYETSTDSMQVNTTAWTTDIKKVFEGDSVRVKLSTGATSTSDSITVTIGGVSDTYKVTVPSGTSEQMETTRFKNALITPLASTTVTAIDSFVVMLKDTFALDSLSQMFNAIYLHAIETEEASKFNLVKRAHDITESGTDLLWTTNEGWKGDYDGGNVVGTGYLDCNYNFATDTNSIAGRLSIGVTTYIRNSDSTDGPWNNQPIYSVNEGGVGTVSLNTRRDDNTGIIRLNDETWSTTFSNASPYVGVYTLNRISNTRTVYKNSASLFSETQATTGIPNLELWLLRSNTDGVVAGRSSPKQISITMVHRGLTSLTEHQSLRNILEWWMDRWNKGVL